MADTQTLKVSVVTPEGAAYEGEASGLVAPAFDGEVAFYPMHAPFVGVLGNGELRITRAADDVTECFYLAGGVVQVADNEVSILAEKVIPSSQLDLQTTQAELAEALAAPAQGEAEIAARVRNTDDARARIRTAERASECS